MTYEAKSVDQSKYGVTSIVPQKRLIRPEHPYANVLPSNVRIEDRGALGVFLIETPIPTTHVRNGKEVQMDKPDLMESRVDSRQDAEAAKLGIEPWYLKHLAAAKATSSK